MRTFQAVLAPDGGLRAFEVENAYIGPAAIARVLRQTQGVTDIEQRRMFSRSSDVHVRFKYLGQACIVWEPYGDNSRYWIGPENVNAFVGDLESVEQAFVRYQPSPHRALVGDILTLRLFKRPMP